MEQVWDKPVRRLRQAKAFPARETAVLFPLQTKTPKPAVLSSCKFRCFSTFCHVPKSALTENSL